MSAPIPIGVRIVGGTVMLASAGVFGYLAISMLRKSYKRVTKGIATRGIVAGFQTKTLGVGVGSRQYFQEVEFQTMTGQKISFVSSFGSQVRPNVGRKVKVLYYSDNPQDAAIASFLKLWLFPLPFLVGAIAFLVFSVLLFSGGAIAK